MSDPVAQSLLEHYISVALSTAYTKDVTVCLMRLLSKLDLL